MQLSVITSTSEPELTRLQAVFDHGVAVSGRGELESLLGWLLAREVQATPKSLDLIGHTTAGKLLAIGDWVIDTSNPAVSAFFRELADLDVLPRLGIHAVRLLGCVTAESGPGRRTMCALSELLGIEVYGTRELIYAAHYGPSGFIADELLACSSDLRREALEPWVATLSGPRILDLDALPASPVEHLDRAWPVRVATVDQTQAVLHHVDRRGGTAMPGLLARPLCELALPSGYPDAHHRLEILLDGELVRAYDESGAGIVYAVDDPSELDRLIVENLPLLRTGVVVNLPRGRRSTGAPRAGDTCRGAPSARRDRPARRSARRRSRRSDPRRARC